MNHFHILIFPLLLIAYYQLDHNHAYQLQLHHLLFLALLTRADRRIQIFVESFQQISEFCGLHELEVQGIADGEVAIGMRGYDPIDNKQLTKEEISRCENDSSARLQLISSDVIDSLPPRKKDSKYTPLSLRQEKPYAILWLVKRYPDELSSCLVHRDIF